MSNNDTNLTYYDTITIFDFPSKIFAHPIPDIMIQIINSLQMFVISLLQASDHYCGIGPVWHDISRKTLIATWESELMMGNAFMQ
jgi:hypothetical protein